MSTKEHEATIGRPQVWARRGLVRLTEPVFPHQLAIVDKGLQKAEKYLSEGKGLLILPIHGSARDVVEFLRLTFSSEIMQSKRVVAPMAAHHYRPGLKSVTERTIGVRIHAVVTPHSRKIMPPAETRRHRAGIGNYIDDAVTTLDQGGIIILAPQVERQAYLGQPQSAVEILIKRVLRREIIEPAIMFMGFDLAGGAGYGTEGYQGLNLGTKYVVIAGPTFSLSQALEEAGGVEKIDAWSFEQLARLAPPGYAEET